MALFNWVLPPIDRVSQNQIFEAATSGVVPLIARGASGQTANVFEVRNSADSVLFSVDGSGNVAAAGTITITIDEAVTGNETVTGNLVVNGNTTLGNAVGDTLIVNATSTFVNPVTFSGGVTYDGKITIDVDETEALLVRRNGDIKDVFAVNTLGWTFGGTDDVIFYLGNDKNAVLLNRSTILAADTALSGVLENTVESQAIAANSLMISNVTNDGDIALYVSKAGNSQMALWADGSTGDTALMAASGSSVDTYIAGVKQIDYATGAMAFQQATTISTTTGALTLTPTTTVNIGTNNIWLTQKDSAGTSTVNLIKNNASDQIEVGGALAIDGGLIFPTDGGSMTAANMSITAATAHGYTFMLASTPGLTIYGTGDAAGGLSAAGLLVGIGTITPTYDLDVQKAGSTSNVSIRAYNTSNAAAASHAIVEASVGGVTSTGDPQLRLTIPSGTSWYVGVDNSDSDIFEIGIGTAIGTTRRLLLDPRSSGTNITQASLEGAALTVTDGAANVGTGVNVNGRTFTHSGTTQVTALEAMFSVGGLTINQSGGAITVNKATGHSSVGPGAGVSVTLTHSSGYRVLTGGAAVNVSGLYVEAQTAGTTSNYGIYVEDITSGVADYGVYIAGGDTYALWVDSDTSRFDGVLTLNDKVTTYNAVATTGWGVPAIYGTAARVVDQTAQSVAVSVYTVGAADGSFEVSANVNVTASGTHSFSMDVTYTDETNTARTLILPMVQLAGNFVTGGLITNVTGVGPYESPVIHIRAKAATSITIRPSAGTFTSVTYNAEGIIKQTA